ncbi:MAG: hypothetical protein R3E79_05695 [Caldilineaceae bacterium]
MSANIYWHSLQGHASGSALRIAVQSDYVTLAQNSPFDQGKSSLPV